LLIYGLLIGLQWGHDIHQEKLPSNC